MIQEKLSFLIRDFVVPLDYCFNDIRQLWIEADADFHNNISLFFYNLSSILLHLVLLSFPPWLKILD